jgi:putative transposase
MAEDAVVWTEDNRKLYERKGLRYPIDLTDEEWQLWQLISGLFATREHRGANRSYELRRILDGCFYVLRGGISWRMMPHDLPLWRVVYDHFSTWRKSGKWERINQVLRERYRTKRGRDPLPTAPSSTAKRSRRHRPAGRGAMMVARRSRVASGKRSSIPKEPFSR